MIISYKLKNGYVELWSTCEYDFDNKHEFEDDESLTHFNDNYYDYKEVGGVLVYDNTHNGKTILEKKRSISRRIIELKKKLVDMDYKTSKRLDGDYTDEEWQTIVMERKAIRLEIRELENKEV